MLAVIFLFLASLALAQSPTVHYVPANPGATIQSAKWSIANSSTNLTITNQAGTVVTTAKAAATTQSLTIFALPAKAMVLSCVVKSTTAFTGTTTLVATLGITGTLTACVSTPFDLKAAVAVGNFGPPTLTVPIITYAGTNLILALTSTIDNISSISAGVVDVTITWQILP
jgi:hypothetical protein